MRHQSLAEHHRYMAHHTAEETVEFDVIVAGLGTAGAIAAIAAARRGLRVLGIEQLSAMGGTGTTGGVLNYYFGAAGGLYETIDDRSQQFTGPIYTPTHGISAESKQLVLEEEALQAGVVIHYETTVIDVLIEDKHVKGLVCFSPERGTYKITCHIVIDCTGNADICRLAGCALRSGRQFDGQSQPFSNAIFRMERNHVRSSYMDSGYVNTSDPLNLSEAIIDSSLLPTHLKNQYDEDNDYFRIAPQFGIRESCHINGEYNVTFQDILEDRFTQEPLFSAFSNLDNHGVDLAFESTLQQDWSVNAGLWAKKLTVPIPLGALIPAGYDGLLVAGRCLAVDHDLAACVRMKKDMQKCGEAAATAAFVAIRNHVSLRHIPYAELKTLLCETGCLSESPTEADSGQWVTEVSRIRDGLASTNPAISIWSIKRIGISLRDSLLGWMEETDDEHLRKHSAIALALLDDQEAAAVLREMVRERDSFIPGERPGFNHARGYKAVCLLGRLAHQAAVPELIDILHDPHWQTVTQTNQGPLLHESIMKFQYISHAIMALIRIGDRHPDSRVMITEALEHYQAQSAVALSMPLWGNKYFSLDVSDKIQNAVNQSLLRWNQAS